MNHPLVSICIPVYNGEKFIEETLNSVINQDFNNFEIIISDDCSKDSSILLIKNFFRKNKIKNFKLLCNSERQGIGKNWNLCLKNSTGKYIKFLLQDDIIYSDCLSEMVCRMEVDHSLGLVASKRKIIKSGHDNEYFDYWIKRFNNLQKDIEDIQTDFYKISNDFFESDKFFLNPINKIGEPSVVLFRADLILRVGLFREDLSQVLDFEYWFRILKHSNIGIINKELIGFRLHNGQATFNNTYINSRNEMDKFFFLLLKRYFFVFSNSNRKILLKKNFLALKKSIKRIIINT